MKTYNIDKRMVEIIQKRIIDKEELVDYIHRQIEQKKYSSCLNTIIINDKYTCFDQYNKNLLINFKQILDEANQLFIASSLRNDKDIFINMWLLIIIIHEMEHIKQRSYFYGGAENYLEGHICLVVK